MSAQSSPAEVAVVRSLEDAERAYKRVQPELEAQDPATFTAQNVDVVSAASIALGTVRTILSFRPRMVALPEFDLRNVDGLEGAR